VIEGADALELRFIERFASKKDLDALGRKVDNLQDEVDDHRMLITIIDLRLKAILSILIRIAWLIATPVILGIGYMGYLTVLEKLTP
jgi:hypothetical protein